MSSTSPPPRRPRLALRWRIVLALLTVSLLPLALVGLGSWSVFGRLLIDKTLELQRTAVRAHASAIDLYLAERLRALQVLARTHQIERLTAPGELGRVFEALRESYPRAFVDLGVIDASGRHVAYVGPYDLADKRYGDAPWFGATLQRGSYVSDIFLGHRNEPHLVIAVRRNEPGRGAWVLRATVDSQSFYSLVRLSRFGSTGDAFIVDRRGRYQTPPNVGQVLAQSPIRIPQLHRGTRDSRIELFGQRLVRVSAWLGDNQRMLVVQQDEDEITAPARRAMAWGALVVLVAVVLVVTTTFFATWHLTDQIDKVTAQREHLDRELLRSAKLASVGELATGLAHEINNPLAIITADQTNIRDRVEGLAIDAEVRAELLDSIDRCKRQVARCGGITSKMLDFGRKSDTAVTPTDIVPLLEETVALMQRQALVRNVVLTLRAERGLPRLLLNGTELEQVLVNLLTNALHAIEGAGTIAVSAALIGDEVRISVRDSGGGILPEDLERIFEPFYTTKPVGQGTGLGLAVCYGVVHRWGGKIVVESEPGAGTLMAIHLPVPRSRGNRRSEPQRDPGGAGIDDAAEMR